MSQDEMSMQSILIPAACCNKIKVPRLHKCSRKKKKHIKLKKEMIKNKVDKVNYPTSRSILSIKGDCHLI